MDISKQMRVISHLEWKHYLITFTLKTLSLDSTHQLEYSLVKEEQVVQAMKTKMQWIMLNGMQTISSMTIASIWEQMHSTGIQP